MNEVRYPAEWEEQAATLLALPHNSQNWDCRRDRIERFYYELMKTISRFQEVRITGVPTNDIWIRDYGPFFVKREGLEAVSFEFNSWGAKFPPWDKDNKAAELIAQQLKIPFRKHNFILEGGAMEFNGEGLCLTTEPCLFGANRNSKKDEGVLIAAIKESLGISSLKVLGEGLPGDHTDGHIDNLARFTAKNRVVIAEGFSESKREIESWLSEHYENVQVDELPLPPQKKLGDETLPASYLNFIFANGALIVPVYNCAADNTALQYFKSIFPDREVIGLDASAPIEEGGSLHCLSKQMPA